MGLLLVTVPRNDLNTALQQSDIGIITFSSCIWVSTINLFAYVHAILKFYYFKNSGLPSCVVTIIFCFPVIPAKCFFCLFATVWRDVWFCYQNVKQWIWSPDKCNISFPSPSVRQSTLTWESPYILCFFCFTQKFIHCLWREIITLGTWCCFFF